MAKTADMTSKLQSGNPTATPPDNKPVITDPANTLAALLARQSKQIERALPRHMDTDRFTRIALTTIRTNPALLECTPASLLAAVMQSAQLGLEPGLIGHCYLVPFSRKIKEYNKPDRWVKDVQFILGYRGMIELSRRSEKIKSLIVREVYENDIFVLEYGIDEDRFKHVPWNMRTDKKHADPGELKCLYLIVRYKDGGADLLPPVSKFVIDQHRARSKSPDSGPWVTDYLEMAQKTVVRMYWKWLPISIDLARQIETADETVKDRIEPDMSDVPTIDVPFVNLGPEPNPAGAQDQPKDPDIGQAATPPSQPEPPPKVTLTRGPYKPKNKGAKDSDQNDGGTPTPDASQTAENHSPASDPIITPPPAEVQTDIPITDSGAGTPNNQYFNAFWGMMEDYAAENSFDSTLFEAAVVEAIFTPIGMKDKVDQVSEVLYQNLINRRDDSIKKCVEKFFWRYPGTKEEWEKRQAEKQQTGGTDNGMY